ncbi:MAG: AAA family ATPase [Planctomycetota bacterium]
MYESHFGFERSPFNNTPDTSFYFPSERHNEALAQLLYTVTARKGFAVVTGEIGAGKTTLCRALFRQLDEEETVTALITNPRLTGIQLLYAVAREFGLDVEGKHRVGILDAINDFLIRMLGQDKNVVLIIDEAQNLPLSTMEEVRLISNLETETEKLIQILLLGQPELKEKIQHRSLKQLRQRIAMRYHLEALDVTETLQYIKHRMKIAGPHHIVRFSNRALPMVHRYSGGIPRLINLVCDRALITAYAENDARITSRVVMAAIREIEGPDWTFKRAQADAKDEEKRTFLRLPFFSSRDR